jgi:hypothetical protein
MQTTWRGLKLIQSLPPCGQNEKKKWQPSLHVFAGRARQALVLVDVPLGNRMRILERLKDILDIGTSAFLWLLAILSAGDGNWTLTILFASLSLYPITVIMQRRLIDELIAGDWDE